VPPVARRWLRRALVALGLALLAWLISRFPLGAIADACVAIGPGVAITPVICMCWFSASSAALYQLLGAAVPWRALLWNRVVGEGYNALVPAAGLGGEPVKLRLLTRYVDGPRALAALVDDRLIENAIALVFSAALVGLGALRLDVSPALEGAMASYAIGAGAIGIAVAVIVLASISGRISRRIARWFGGGELGGAPVPRRLVVRAFGWTLAARAFGLVEIAILFALLGVPVTAWSVTFTGGAVAAAGFVGGVIPQGIGITEAATVGVFELLHLPGPAGVAFALARRGRMLVMSVLGVLLHVIVRAWSAE